MAMKMNDDNTLKNSDFAQIGGVSLQEMNAMEIFLLQQLDYRAQVSDEDYSACLTSLEQLAQAIKYISESPEQLSRRCPSPAGEFRPQSSGSDSGE